MARVITGRILRERLTPAASNRLSKICTITDIGLSICYYEDRNGTQGRTPGKFS
jgi:hypothetical protein